MTKPCFVDDLAVIQVEEMEDGKSQDSKDPRKITGVGIQCRLANWEMRKDLSDWINEFILRALIYTQEQGI